MLSGTLLRGLLSLHRSFSQLAPSEKCRMYSVQIRHISIFLNIVLVGGCHTIKHRLTEQPSYAVIHFLHSLVDLELFLNVSPPPHRLLATSSMVSLWHAIQSRKYPIMMAQYLVSLGTFRSLFLTCTMEPWGNSRQALQAIFQSHVTHLVTDTPSYEFCCSSFPTLSFEECLTISYSTEPV